MAAAVRKELWDGLGSARHNLSCADVWLLRPPPGVCGGFWQVVCAAALEAMERGRKVLWASEEEEEA